MKNKLIILVLIFLIIGLFGCEINNSDLSDNNRSKVSLNDRQKSILKENGLPTEYDELLPSQKMAIVAIDKMLCYVEEKYGIPFSYAGYVSASPLEKVHMIAYPTSGSKTSDCFTITNNGNSYEDNYIDIAINDEFTSYISENVKSSIPNSEFKIFINITKTYFNEIPKPNTDFEGMVESNMIIYIDESTFKGDINNFIEQFKKFMEEHKLYGIYQIILLKEGNLEHLTRYNHTDYLSDEFYTVRETIYVQK